MTDPADSSGDVDRREEIARFVFHNSSLASGGTRAHPGAYLPRGGKTSIFRIQGLSVEQVATVGSAYLQNPPPFAHLLSRAEVVFDVGLHFDPDKTPERHANIVGWPDRKEEQKLLAIKIAGASEVVRYES